MADLTFQPFSGMSPGQADYARKFGGKLVQQGTSVAPLQHWTQALARALQGGSGALWNDQAAASEKEGQDRIGQIYQAGMNGQVNPSKMAGLLMGQTGGWGQGQGQQVANQVISQRMKAADPMLDLRRKQIEGQLALQKAQLGQLKNQSYDAQVAKRAEIAQRFGIDPNSQEYKNFVLGKEYGGGGSFGKTGAVFRGEDGKYYTIQFGENGQRRILPVDGGLTPDRGVTQVGNTLVDKTTGKVRQDVTQSIAAGEKAKQEGKAEGVSSGSLANSIQVAGDMIKQINNLLSDPYLPSMTGLVGGRLPNISENAQRVDSKMKQITGSTFLVAYERLKGGGQITEIEGKKGEQAIARLNQAQSYNDYVEALNELKRVVQNGLIRSRVNAGQLPKSALTRVYDFEGQQPPSTGQGQPSPSAPQLPPGFSIKKVE